MQQIALFPHMTIEQNITVVPEMKKWPKEKMKQRAYELMNMVGLDPENYADRKPNELSGGEQQRIGVIRALAADPEIILMDEPFSALDPISREKLQDDMIDLKRNLKKTTVFVTHDMQEALKLADRICMMKDGEIVQVGTPQELVTNPANDFVREFVGEKFGNWPNHIDLEAMVQPLASSEMHPSIVIPVSTSFSELLDLLSVHEQLVVENDGKQIGVINRQTLIQFLSAHMPERGMTDE
ncbi:hypothetical protein B4167_2138 [Caldibacillus thermoamylovorans]|uniref:ABC transporter domain-containing protein n=1 Tax=Caldibacillus thermoamylovorans TaxID=35841 RepID=A0ABD4A835_9BACI|nr:hypothetical protein B4167_2138 [Caldibacillus thermoamylovorans]